MNINTTELEATQAEHEMLFFQILFGCTLPMEKAVVRQVGVGVGRCVKMTCNWMLKLVIENTLQNSA